MEEITNYRLSNGTELSSKSSAELGQKIIDASNKVIEAKEELKDLKRHCLCEERVKDGQPRKDVRTETNSWGTEYGVVYTSQPYRCKVCGATWYHHVEDAMWFKW